MNPAMFLSPKGWLRPEMRGVNVIPRGPFEPDPVSTGVGIGDWMGM